MHPAWRAGPCVSWFKVLADWPPMAGPKLQQYFSTSETHLCVGVFVTYKDNLPTLYSLIMHQLLRHSLTAKVPARRALNAAAAASKQTMVAVKFTETAAESDQRPSLPRSGHCGAAINDQVHATGAFAQLVVLPCFSRIIFVKDFYL